MLNRSRPLTAGLSLGKRGQRYALREDLQLDAITRVLWFHRWMLLTASLVGGLGSFLLFYNLDRIYEATVLIEANIDELNIIDFSNDDGGQDTDQVNLEDTIVFLTSGSFLENLVEKLRLIDDEEFFSSEYRLDRQRADDAVNPIDDANRPEEDITAMTSGDLHINATIAGNLLERLSVSQIGGSNIISITASSINPVKAARIVNSMATLYLEYSQATRQDWEGEAIAVLKARIDGLRGEVVGIEGQILEYKIKHQIQDFDDDQPETRSVDVQRTTLTTELALAKAGLAEAEARRQQLAVGSDTRIGALAPITLTSPTLRELTISETELLRRQSQLAAEFGVQHPLMVTLNGELEVVRQRMQDEVFKIQTNLRNDVAETLARTVELETQIDLLNAKSTTQKQANIGLLDLKQRSATAQALLDELLVRYQALVQQVDLGKATARIMSPASIPVKHVYPKVGLFSALAAAVALAIAGLLVFLYDRWVSDFGFTTMDQLRDFEVTPLGVVPNLREKEAGGRAIEDYVISHPQSAQAEAFQRIRTKLLHLGTAGGTLGQVVLLTSSLPLEGKTSTAVILARQAAMAGARVLLIDADLRRPRVHEVLNVPNDTGLAELLAGAAGEDDTLQSDSQTSLTFLPAGRNAQSPADLFRSSKMEVLMNELRQHFGWIIIDSPPVGAVVDSLVLSAHVDLCVFVARWRDTTRSTIMSNLSQLRDAGAPVAGLVLSRVDVAAQEKYGDVDLGQYYGHYQKFEDHAPRKLPEPTSEAA